MGAAGTDSDGAVPRKCLDKVPIHPSFGLLHPIQNHKRSGTSRDPATWGGVRQPPNFIHSFPPLNGRSGLKQRRPYKHDLAAISTQRRPFSKLEGVFFEQGCTGLWAGRLRWASGWELTAVRAYRRLPLLGLLDQQLFGGHWVGVGPDLLGVGPATSRYTGCGTCEMESCLRFAGSQMATELGEEQSRNCHD
jgi:hypothetical protein